MVQISEVCTHVTKVVCANTANVYVVKAQMYNLRLGTGTSWSNTRTGEARGQDIAKVVGKSNVVLFSSPARFQENPPCCILSSEPPNLSRCPAPLDFKKTFLLCILSCDAPNWLLDWRVRKGVNTCPRSEQKTSSAKNCKSVLKTVAQVLVRDGQAPYRGDSLRFESSGWTDLLRIGHTLKLLKKTRIIWMSRLL